MLDSNQKREFADNLFPLIDLVNRKHSGDLSDSALREVIEMGKERYKSKGISKRFSPNDIDIEGINGRGVNMIGKIYTKEHPEGIAEPEHGYKSFGEFAYDVLHAGIPDGHQSDKLRNWQGKTAGFMESGSGDMGGYLIPTQFANRILMTSLESSIVRPRAMFMPLTSNRLEIPAAIDPDHSTNLFGGIVLYQTGEGGQYTATNPKFAKIGLTLHKITGLTHVTDELLDDNAVALEAFLQVAFAQSISFIEDEKFLNGLGANEPLGALASGNPSLITVDAVSGQGDNTVTAENVIDMWSRMYSAGKRNAVWLYSPTVFPQLSKMSLSTGTSGIPIWLPGGSIAEASYSTLFGRPLIETEHCQALGTAGDIACVDFSQYIVAGKGSGEPKFATSIHFRFDTGEQSFRWTLRYDGTPWWTSTMTPIHGTSTLSPFIVLSGSRS